LDWEKRIESMTMMAGRDTPRGGGKKGASGKGVTGKQKRKENNIVTRAIDEHFGGHPVLMAMRLGVSRQRVNNWIVRGCFPPDSFEQVHRLMKIPLTELLRAWTASREGENGDG